MVRTIIKKQLTDTNRVHQLALAKLKKQKVIPTRKLTSMELNYLANLLSIPFHKSNATEVKLNHAQSIELSKHGLTLPNKFIAQKLTKSSEGRLKKRQNSQLKN